MAMPISTRLMVMKALKLDDSFRHKTECTNICCIYHLLKANDLLYHMMTHESEHNPAQVQAEAKEWICSIHHHVVGPFHYKQYIINWDQTPVFFAMNPKHTYEIIGTKTITLWINVELSTCVTLAMTITAAVMFLEPMIVFKGKLAGQIQHEFTQYPAVCLYTCQDNAWMDEHVMNDWVQHVLKPYVEMAPEHIIPILFLDSYHCHTMQSIVHEIEDLSVEVQHIPAGCTSLCQLVDVGVNKPFNSCLQY